MGWGYDVLKMVRGGGGRSFLRVAKESLLKGLPEELAMRMPGGKAFQAEGRGSKYKGPGAGACLGGSWQ